MSWTYKTKSPLSISSLPFSRVSRILVWSTHLCVFSSLMMVKSAFSCVVGGKTSAFSGSSALLTLLPEAGRQVVMMGFMMLRVVALCAVVCLCMTALCKGYRYLSRCC